MMTTEGHTVQYEGLEVGAVTHILMIDDNGSEVKVLFTVCDLWDAAQKMDDVTWADIAIAHMKIYKNERLIGEYTGEDLMKLHGPEEAFADADTLYMEFVLEKEFGIKIDMREHI